MTSPPDKCVQIIFLHFAVILSNWRLVETSHFGATINVVVAQAENTVGIHSDPWCKCCSSMGGNEGSSCNLSSSTRHLTWEWTKSRQHVNLPDRPGEESFFSSINIIHNWVLLASTFLFTVNYCKTLYICKPLIVWRRQNLCCKSPYLTLPVARVGKQFKCLTFLLTNQIFNCLFVLC